MTTYEEPIEAKIDFNLDTDEIDDDITDIDEKNMFATSIISHKKTMEELNKTVPINNQYPFLLDNEEAKIIGLRAQQLANGASALVDTTGMTCVIKIAKKELKEGVNPFVIRRTLPDGTFVDLRVNELRR